MIPTMQYMLAALVSYLGIVAGIIVSAMSIEELKDGRRYFILLQHSLFVTILLISFYVHKTSWWTTLFIIVTMIFVLSFAQKLNTHRIGYPVCAILLYINQLSKTIFFITAALIFLYGMPTAALQIHHMKKNNYVMIFLKDISFLIICYLLYLIF